MEIPRPLRIAQELLAFEHTISDIAIVYIGMAFAPTLTIYQFFFITLAFLSARPAALMLNRYAGRKFDIDNKKKRHVISLQVPKNKILIMFLVFAVIFVASAYMLNTLSFALSFIVLLFFAFDPVTKEHSAHRHFNIGLIEGFGCLGGYIGATGTIPTMLPLYIIVLAAVFIGGGSDIIYTIKHVEFDEKHKLKTYPTKYGIEKSLNYSFYSHALAGILLVLFGLLTNSAVILAGATISTIILVYKNKHIDYKNDKAAYREATSIKSNVWTIMLLAVILSKFI